MTLIEAMVAKAKAMTKEEIIQELKGQSWYCHKCAIEVYDRRCRHCGKLERDKA